MTDLLSQLQSATEGSRELDAAIAVATFYREPDSHGDSAYVKLPHKHDECAVGTYWLVSRSGMMLRTAPFYTTNLQDAVSLIKGLWMIGKQEFEPFCHILPPNDRGDFIGQEPIIMTGATPCLAACSAIIKAHESSKAEAA